jgi:hypothetical protein
MNALKSHRWFIKKEEDFMLTRWKKWIAAGVGFLILFAFSILSVAHLLAADPIVGEWNYTTSNHWVRGVPPAGKPSKGILVISQGGDPLKMEFKSGMVFSPPELKYFAGKKKGEEYIFSNSAKVDNEGGVAKNTCNLKMISSNHFKGKSYSEYSNSGITFSWGFDIELKR